MDTTFISIHDLTPDARILYSSDSVIDILGYTPDEIVNQSAWDFFPKDELPYSQAFHQKRVVMDKAAVLAYCNVRAKDGGYVTCECCFTIVYDVMIVCTSIYRRGLASDKRRQEAPLVRRIFSSSPRDPRYHMLSHISAKFKLDPQPQIHEPRAALFLNRFTRTLTIMYATSGLQDVIGIPAETMRGRSFYYCIAENCLQDAVKCLENAKGNDSIAYLRFWFRDPRIDDEQPPPDEDSDEEMTTDVSEDPSMEGGVQLDSGSATSPESSGSGAAQSTNSMDVDCSEEKQPNSRTSSGDSTRDAESHEAIFGTRLEAESSTSSLVPSPERERHPSQQPFNDPIELEAVVSCTSDGLVVCLRKARPMIPHPTSRPSEPVHQHGLFAAPWAQEPILPPVEQRAGAGFGAPFAPALGPQGAARPAVSTGPARHDFLSAIREQAVFAWALTGINGSLADYAHGKPGGEALPMDGVPIWEPDAQQQKNGFDHGSNGGSDRGRSGSASAKLFGDPGLDRIGGTPHYR